ncbi:GTPase-activating protein [Apiospora rasikravindrae]|uniref:GTPase-activating protein n=1 Tax=Apiospora rasikravindrae TaxID=990691 RepID=A0ABR1RNL3_9PEZI
MFNISNLVQKAQSAAQQLIDPMQGLNLTNSDRNPAKSTLFQHQFRLPSSQTPLYEIPAELTIPLRTSPKATKSAIEAGIMLGSCTCRRLTCASPPLRQASSAPPARRLLLPSRVKPTAAGQAAMASHFHYVPSDGSRD